MFLSLPSSSSLFLPCLLFFLLHSPPVTAKELRYHLCGDSNYTANSTYKTNLNLLLPSLVSNASFSGGFSSVMIGQFPNQAYGLALCRGDFNASMCQSCLDTASNDIVRLCPYAIEAVVWYDACLLRYSNLWSLATTKDTQLVYRYAVNNITTDRPLFEKLRNELLNAIADWAAYNTTMRFATGEVSFTTGFRTIYGLVQCTPDLWASQCRQCLQDSFEWISMKFPWAQGGRVLQARCNHRYEVYKFYDGASMIKIGSPAPPPVNPGNKKNVRGMVLIIAIPLVASSLLISITCIFFWTRRNSAKNLPYEANLEEITHAESLLLDLSMLKDATASFSEANKLGAGGFGAVYKGTLPNGQEFAAKRLSTTSRQGLAELKNELVLVAKLRHRNLVRLLGVCLEEQEKLLVYEYVPNRSLDTILFGISHSI
ncbi:putative Cysteine-rich receptor-like protein kinase 10 [Cocos nucifera]|uniref:Putative Cysteine-rich receptor-like protein kinase 10 n=1 Tax=Cocos nucifera TaxID=13894 RepID=A0A8K0I0C2_COCNU|nr:putative Cysteine-rich receptor-like protein kinase 10 [Cocos nucifera]